MLKPHQSRRLSRLGKKAAPYLSWILVRSFFLRLLRLASWYIPFLMGQGSGAGWDMKGEAKAARPYIQRPGAVIFDVGANTGDWARTIASETAEGSCFYLIEPTMQCVRQLHNLRLPNTTIIHAAAGSENGTTRIFIPSNGISKASLHKRRDTFIVAGEQECESVNLVTIDHLVEEYKINQIDFMKIDTEGHELAVLRGCSKTLKDRRLKAFAFEFGSAHINSRTFFRDIWDLLRKYDFRLMRICPGGRLLDIDDYYEDLEYFRGVSNYVAVLRDA